MSYCTCTKQKKEKEPVNEPVRLQCFRSRPGTRAYQLADFPAWRSIVTWHINEEATRVSISWHLHAELSARPLLLSAKEGLRTWDHLEALLLEPCKLAFWGRSLGPGVLSLDSCRYALHRYSSNTLVSLANNASKQPRTTTLERFSSIAPATARMFHTFDQ